MSRSITQKHEVEQLRRREVEEKKLNDWLMMYLIDDRDRNRELLSEQREMTWMVPWLPVTLMTMDFP